MQSSTHERVARFPPVEPTEGFPYRIISIVGEGAMGVVYRAEDIELGRDVAIKVMRPSFIQSLSPRDTREAIGRFMQEAKAAAALSHPGVTVVHRVGTVAGQPYIAMEWLEGWTVEELIATGGAVSVHDATRLGLHVLAVLGAAHEAGIVHRDIKPANLIVTREHRVKVTDFGIARVRGSALAQTQAGLVVGTPQYAAPEQLAGKPIDGRADLYAVGVVLYEMVTGHPPFVADSGYELVRLVQTSAAPPPSSRSANVPPAFDAFMASALAKSPHERFASAKQMAAALLPFLNKPAASPQLTTVPAPDTAPTLRVVPGVRVDAETVAALVVATVRTWKTTVLGRRPVEKLFERLLYRPLHAPAFCGALVAGDRCMLICDGLVYAAVDATSGLVGDAVIEALPEQIDATLHAAPEGLAASIIPLLASLLLPSSTTLSGLEASFANLPHLADRLCGEEFDGAIRFAQGSELGFALFNRGKRVIDIFTAGWNGDIEVRGWQEWIGQSRATASVEPLQVQFPSMTFRQQLAGLELEVVRPQAVTDSGRIRSDAFADARALQLRPRDEDKARLRRGDSTLQGLVCNDPIFPLVRWLLTDLEVQFNQFQRGGRWKGLIAPLSRVSEVRFHHRIMDTGSHADSFDAVFYAPDKRLVHVVDHVAVGDRHAVEQFLARAMAAKTAHDDLGGAILIAPQFSEDALDAYLHGMRRAARQSLRGVLENSLSHREGFVRFGRGGYHVLLIESAGEQPRPLVPE